MKAGVVRDIRLRLLVKAGQVEGSWAVCHLCLRLASAQAFMRALHLLAIRPI
jgi:hypothetical protein